jgi:hypothetical protein
MKSMYRIHIRHCEQFPKQQTQTGPSRGNTYIVIIIVRVHDTCLHSMLELY